MIENLHCCRSLARCLICSNPVASSITLTTAKILSSGIAVASSPATTTESKSRSRKPICSRRLDYELTRPQRRRPRQQWRVDRAARPANYHEFRARVARLAGRPTATSQPSRRLETETPRLAEQKSRAPKNIVHLLPPLPSSSSPFVVDRLASPHSPKIIDLSTTGKCELRDEYSSSRASKTSSGWSRLSADSKSARSTPNLNATMQAV